MVGCICMPEVQPPPFFCSDLFCSCLEFSSFGIFVFFFYLSPTLITLYAILRTLLSQPYCGCWCHLLAVLGRLPLLRIVKRHLASYPGTLPKGGMENPNHLDCIQWRWEYHDRRTSWELQCMFFSGLVMHCLFVFVLFFFLWLYNHQSSGGQLKCAATPPAKALAVWLGCHWFMMTRL